MSVSQRLISDFESQFNQGKHDFEANESPQSKDADYEDGYGRAYEYAEKISAQTGANDE